MIACYECETSGQNCPAHRVPPPAAQLCACGQPTWAHEDRYCTPPRDEHDAERRNYPRTCAEAGDFCVHRCSIRGVGQDETIMDPDCFRGREGTERLAAWRRSREKVSDAPVPSVDVTLPDGSRGELFAAAPTPRPQCQFCGGPGHAYGERCLRELSGRSFNLQSPSARLGYAIAQLRGLRTLNAEYVDTPGATTTAKFAEGVLKHTVDALDAIHEALADLYTGRL